MYSISTRTTCTCTSLTTVPFYHMSSFGESSAFKHSENSSHSFIEYNKKHISRIYPSGRRMDSSNYEPVDMWNCGCQIGKKIHLHLYMYITYTTFLALNEAFTHTCRWSWKVTETFILFLATCTYKYMYIKSTVIFCIHVHVHVCSNACKYKSRVPYGRGTHYLYM